MCRPEKAQLILHANTVLQQIRALARDYKLQEPALSTLLGLADVRIVHWVVNKPDPTRGVFSSVGAIGHAFCQDMSTVLDMEVNSPWAASSIADAALHPAQPTFKTFDADGRWANAKEVVTGKGFVPGATVTRSVDGKKTTFTIKAVTHKDLQLHDDKGCQLSSPHSAVLKNQIVLVTDAKVGSARACLRDGVWPERERETPTQSATNLARFDPCHKQSSVSAMNAPQKGHCADGTHTRFRGEGRAQLDVAKHSLV